MNAIRSNPRDLCVPPARRVAARFPENFRVHARNARPARIRHALHGFESSTRRRRGVTARTAGHRRAREIGVGTLTNRMPKTGLTSADGARADTPHLSLLRTGTL
jgi:hypothetical protein